MIKVIEVSAPWCAQCKGFKPIFDSVKKELETADIQFSEVNADDDDDFVEKYKIQSLPTTLITNDKGDLLKKIVGLKTHDALRDDILSDHYTE